MSQRSLFRICYQRSKFTNYAPIALRGEQKQKEQRNSRWKYLENGMATALFSAVLVGSTLKDQIDKRHTQASKPQEKPSNEDEIIEAGQKRPDLPTYTAEEVSKHDSKSSFWVTYKHGVYDVTKFLPSHPGGEQIYNAAGLSIEPFWNVYGMHMTPEIFQLLESYRIGNLQDADVVDHSDDELWLKEPFRDKRLIVKTAKPFNAEIPAKFQIEHFDTPNELFYVRQHMPVPDLDPESHTLKVTIVDGGVHTKVFSLQDLSRFRRGAVRAALMCAGNRRSEMDKFQGSDIDATGVNFSTSIPLEMALDPRGEILLATHMNGEPLPKDHGAPLRVVVPGAPAVRSVKWLESITVSEEESGSHWHQKDYRSFNASQTWETADFPSAPPLYSLPVTSAICVPQDGGTASVADGRVLLQGYAYSGGGAAIVRVDVSADRGRTWLQAQLVRADSAPPRAHYSWTLWAAAVPVHRRDTEIELWVKATDSNFNTQPESFEHIWNIRGILSNAYHKIKVKLDH